MNTIQLNKVGIDIDGKVYQFYKLNFGFQRKLVELQSNLNKIQQDIAKKYEVKPEEVESSDKVPDHEKIELAKAALSIQEALIPLFVNKEEAAIIDSFDSTNVDQLIEALK